MSQHDGTDSPRGAAASALPSDPASLAYIDPELLEDRDFFKYVGDVNVAFTAAQRALEHATIALGQMLTEQICREVEKQFPDAVYLEVGVLETHYVDEHGHRDLTRPALPPVLAPSSVLNADRQPLGTLPPLSPVNHYLERIGEVMDIEPCRLNLHLREWFYPHADDAGDEDMRITGDDFGDDDPLGNHWNA